MSASDKNSKHKRTKLASILLAVTSIFVLFTFIEVGLWIFSDNQQRTIDAAWWDRYVERNRLNYRDNKYDFKKNTDIFRIFVLGDSQTVGHGIENLEDTWPKRLEYLLNIGLPQKRFEVINSAYQGWNTDTQLYELFNNGFAFEPDLVLLGYYLNDIPSSFNFRCDSADKELFNQINSFIPITKHSRLLHFLNSRINRLWEKFQLKPTFSQCINAQYQSIGWEMEKVFLDTLVKGVHIKGVHMMSAIIPVFFKLGANYPFKDTHYKINNWFKNNGVTNLDLWEKGFFGMDANKLIISPTDRHLNKHAAEIIAQTIFQKLEPLKKLPRLTLYQKAFDLETLLTDSNGLKKLDNDFSDLRSLKDTLKYNIPERGTQTQLIAWKKKKRIYFESSYFDNKTKKVVKLQKTELGLNGNLIKNDIFWNDPKSGNPISWNSLSIQKPFSILKVGKYSSNKQKLENKKFKFIYQTIITEKSIRLEIFKDRYFGDPKSLDHAIFTATDNPKLSISDEEVFNITAKIIKSNPRLYFDFKEKQYTTPEQFNLLSRQEKVSLFKEIEWTNYFFILREFGHKKYIEFLIEDILKHNPIPVLLQTIERYYFINKKFEKLRNFQEKNPNFPKRFDF